MVTNTSTFPILLDLHDDGRYGGCGDVGGDNGGGDDEEDDDNNDDDDDDGEADNDRSER